jgi:hypothetical protein
MRRSYRLATLCAVIALAAAPAAALAHHSFAMFDYTKTVTLDGVVKDFQWINPHVVATVYGASRGDAPELWSIELTSPGNLTRQGWTRKALKPGDKVAVDIHPLRDGQHGGAFAQVELLDTGQVIRAGQLVAKRP